MTESDRPSSPDEDAHVEAIGQESGASDGSGAAEAPDATLGSDAAEELPAPPAVPVPVPDPAAIIFDLDGTLVDTVEERIEAWLRTFAEVGIPAERRHVAGLIGADGKRLALEVAAVADRHISDDRAEAIDRRAGEIFSELAQHPRPEPGARELLEALDAARMPWAIATSSRREQAGPSVEAVGLSKPPVLADGSHVREAKPAPDLLLYAAELLGVSAQRTWYVGDSTWDMRAARAAAMTGVGIASGAVGRETLVAAGARLAYDRIPELHAELARRGLIAMPEEAASVG